MCEETRTWMMEDLCYLRTPCIEDAYFTTLAPSKYELSIVYEQYRKCDIMDHRNVVV